MSLNELDREKVNRVLTSNGSCKMNGFIGDVTDFRIGTDGVPEYRTVHEEDGTTIKSTGCILSDSILVRQKQSDDKITFFQLYSWDIVDSNYTHIIFDSGNTLDDCYDRVKDADMNLSHGDIVDNLSLIGVNMDHVAHILTDQEKDTLTDMYTLDDGTTKSSFKR